MPNDLTFYFWKNESDPLTPTFIKIFDITRTRTRDFHLCLCYSTIWVILSAKFRDATPESDCWPWVVSWLVLSAFCIGTDSHFRRSDLNATLFSWTENLTERNDVWTGKSVFRTLGSSREFFPFTMIRFSGKFPVKCDTKTPLVTI